MVSAQSQQLPDWIKNIFVWYGQGQVSDNEILNAIQWLIDNNIIKIKQAPAGVPSKISDNGDFKMIARESSTNYDDLAQVLIDTEPTLESLLNRLYRLPNDVNIVFQDCGKVNASYNPNTRELVFCYELIEYLAEFWRERTDTKADWSLRLGSSIYFILYHEVGHAVVDVNDVPITGMEEDAVDQFSSLYFLSYAPDLADQMLATMLVFFMWHGGFKTVSQDFKFWDEHSFDMQRYYNIACWMYGSNPSQYSWLVTGDTLPKERADRCPSEFKQIQKSWNEILRPYVNFPFS